MRTAAEVAARGQFWCQPNFFGIDLSGLAAPATESYFSQAVVDAFDPAILAATTQSFGTKIFDFSTCSEADLQGACPLRPRVRVCVPCARACRVPFFPEDVDVLGGPVSFC